MSDEFAPDYPDSWIPEPNDVIAGTVTGVSMSPDFGYGPYPIVNLTDADGKEWSVHAQGTVLRRELVARRPGVGDHLEVKYLGKKTPKSGQGNPYKAYAVKGGKEPEFDWGAEAASLGVDTPGQNANGTIPVVPDVPIDSAGLPDVNTEKLADVPF